MADEKGEVFYEYCDFVSERMVEDMSIQTLGEYCDFVSERMVEDMSIQTLGKYM